MTDLIKLYNPANSGSLTPEQLEGMQKLTSPEIKELAIAYPNLTMQRAYLLIIDSTQPPGKQLARLSTFENLWNLREKNAQRNYVAYGFKGAVQAKSLPTKAKKVEVLDLSEVELMDLPGFKSKDKVEPAQEVKVVKVKKTKTKSK